MKYVGNFIDFVKSEWIEYIRDNRGIGRPIEGLDINSEQSSIEYQKIKEAHYDLTKPLWYQFSVKNFPYDVTNPPFIEGKFSWWIIKMNPGNFVPVHIDPFTVYQKSPKRYSMFLQDYEPGHIFFYNDSVVTNYKAGDTFLWPDATALHGACNIGHSLRTVFQFSTDI
jgi:hypothetical protein